MKLFVCTDHDGFWPVPVASVVLADNEVDARLLLDTELRTRGLKSADEKPYALREIVGTGPQAIVLSDGNY